jgi:hypothetical protein
MVLIADLRRVSRWKSFTMSRTGEMGVSFIAVFEVKKEIPDSTRAFVQ